ncbi:histidine kinase [Paramagnetospirillum marisnigri]|uniref:Sensor protein FixL n=1 Tax=Paramagnetospirillum marisnigri TaxID=1285242 RepID=A0A178MQ51_9PROT|nr:PAS-domain containing protein [Paramagnetospirillum marisnigri]OAN50741.1 histidine kinase [Paramagnetospirillum marisnigri]
MEVAAAAALFGALVGSAATLAWTRRRARRQPDKAAAAQRLLVEALSNGTDGVALYDSEHRLIICNERYRALLAPVRDMLQPGIRFDDLVRAFARIEGLDQGWIDLKLSTRTSTGIEEQFRNGLWVLANAYPTHDGGWLRILRDITIRKQAQTSLENTVGWLKGVMDTVVDGIITIDETGTVLSFNPAAQRIFGYGADEVVGRNVNMLMPEPYHSQHDGYISSYLGSGLKRIIGSGREVVGLRRDGTTFPLDLAITEMRDGNMLTFIGVVRDITQRKRVEDALIQGEARFRAQANRLQAIIDNMAQGIAVFDGDDTLIALNRAALRMLSLPGGEIKPGAIDISLFITLLAVSDRPAGEDAVRITSDLAESIRERPEMVFEHAADSGMVMEVRSSSMPGGGLILSFTDVTDRKHTEQTLRHAKDEAERGNRAKNTFLANISHELRTPLNAIIGFSEMMKHEIFGPLEPANYRTYVDDIHDSGMHLLELINDILDMSKAEAGMTDLQESPVDVIEVIRTSIRLMTRRASNSGIQIVDSLPDRLPLLLADERRIRQVMLNLLSNAVKFTDDGGRVEISAHLTQFDDYQITITDNGIGMTPEDLTRVMEPFVQADTRLSRKYEGSGLGLPLTKALVNAHGGQLLLDSAIGRGTSAIVTFPASRVLHNDLAAADI